MPWREFWRYSGDKTLLLGKNDIFAPSNTTTAISQQRIETVWNKSKVTIAKGMSDTIFTMSHEVDEMTHQTKVHAYLG